jgi:hypothetical protein
VNEKRKRGGVAVTAPSPWGCFPFCDRGGVAQRVENKEKTCGGEARRPAPSPGAFLFLTVFFLFFFFFFFFYISTRWHGPA